MDSCVCKTEIKTDTSSKSELEYSKMNSEPQFEPEMKPNEIAQEKDLIKSEPSTHSHVEQPINVTEEITYHKNGSSNEQWDNHGSELQNVFNENSTERKIKVENPFYFRDSLEVIKVESTEYKHEDANVSHEETKSCDMVAMESDQGSYIIFNAPTI